MKAEDLIFDQAGQWQVVKEVGEGLPYVRAAILSQALVVKAIDLSDLSALVIPPEYCDPLPVSDLEGDQKSHCFNTERSKRRRSDDFLADATFSSTHL